MTILANPVSGDLLSMMNPASAATAGSVADAQNRFMTLLVTQMKNQDPLNPLDNAQVTSQLAQLSTVTGIDKLNQTMQAMMDSMSGAQSLQAANMIGHGVLVPGANISLTGGKAVYGVELSGPADSVKLTISDGAGNPVRTIDLGAQQAGTLALGWDGSTQNGGSAPDGRYQVSVTALRGGKTVTSNALAFANVLSVSTGSGGAKLNLDGGLASATLADVRQIL